MRQERFLSCPAAIDSREVPKYYAAIGVKEHGAPSRVEVENPGWSRLGSDDGDLTPVGVGSSATGVIVLMLNFVVQAEPGLWMGEDGRGDATGIRRR